MKGIMRNSRQGTDSVIRWSTAAVVVGVAAVAAYVSYNHAYELVSAHGENGGTARVVPLTVDGLVYASSMVLLDSARHKRRTPRLARWLLGLGITATLAANVAHGAGHGAMGGIVAAWPAVALVGSYELLMSLVRGQVRAPTGTPDDQDSDNAPEIETATDTANDAEQQQETENEEYRQDSDRSTQDSTQDNGTETDETLTAARAIAEEFKREHGRWIRRDELRTEMHCSTKRAADLLRRLKSEQPATTPNGERG